MSDFIDFTVSDAELEIKKRARRRLVGASVLAFLAVIAVLLALSNSEEPRAVPDMQVAISGYDETELPQTVSENDSESAESAESAESDKSAVEPDLASSAAEHSVGEALLPEEPVSKPQVSAAPQRPAPNPPVARSPEEPRKKPSQPSAAEEEARVLALLDGKIPATHAGASTEATRAQGQVFVQVAAFGSADRAAKQVKDLSDQGFAAYAERADKVTRVRIGPLPRNEGEQVMDRLKAKGYKPMLSLR